MRSLLLETSPERLGLVLASDGAGGIVHPELRQTLFPSGPEFVSTADGQSKNDCERHAIRRYLERCRREHAKLKTMGVMDALHANEPIVNLLRGFGLNFVIVAKPSSQATVYEQFWKDPRNWFADLSEQGRERGRRASCAQNLRLTKNANPVRVPMLVSEERQPKRLGSDGQPKLSQWGFITDLEVSSSNAAEIARMGRSRWRIENEVFKTLKSDEGVRLESNYGHGWKHLMETLTLALLTAFQLDQLQALGSVKFQKALAHKKGCVSYLWDAMRQSVRLLPLDSRSMQFDLIVYTKRYRIAVSAGPPVSQPWSPPGVVIHPASTRIGAREHCASSLSASTSGEEPRLRNAVGKAKTQ